MAVEQPAGKFSNLNSQDDPTDELFYFESDHLALKGNKDYSEILKTLFILESQRTRAIKDYDKLIELREQARNDPIAFVEKIKNGESLGVPDVQVIAEVPSIEWSKYKFDIPEEGLKFINSINKTDKINFSTMSNNLNRAETRNKSWTTEEQRRLEELLQIYPREDVELQRFKKIAAALGNRTVKQVSSRVQKYFLKLSKAGLPIPGRMPKHAEKKKRSKLHTHQRYNHYLFKPTTFFPQLDIPVSMNETEDIPGPSMASESHPKMSNYLIPTASHTYEEELNGESEDYLDHQIQILEKVKAEMLKPSSEYTHVGFTCVCCKKVIEGVRWHCKSCEPVSVDYCSSCIVFQIHSNNSHPLVHKLVVVHGPQTPSKANHENLRSVGSSNETNMDSDEECDRTSSSSESNCTNYKVDNKTTRSSESSNNHSLMNSVSDRKENELYLLSEDNFKYLSESLDISGQDYSVYNTSLTDR